MLPRKKSVKYPSDFYKLKKEGLLLKSDNFQIRYVPYNREFLVSVIVSKIVSSSAPKRNKLKRIFKSLIKESGFDGRVLMLIYPKLKSLNSKYSELKVELDSTLNKIKY